jgi:hypothetical protein
LTALLELQAVEERADGSSVIANSGSRNLAASLEKLAGRAGITVGAVVRATRAKFAKAATEKPHAEGPDRPFPQEKRRITRISRTSSTQITESYDTVSILSKI